MEQKIEEPVNTQTAEVQNTLEETTSIPAEKKEVELHVQQPVATTAPATIIPESVAEVKVEVAPQDCGCGGGSANGGMGFIYAIGRIYPRFPSTSIEKEYLYAYEEFKAEGPPNALFYQVLSQGQNLYIAQQMCWVLQIDGVDTYILKPRSDIELYHIIAALAPVNVGEVKFDVVIGPRGPIASYDMCNGLQLPTMVCNLSYDFTFSQFVTHIESAIPNIPVNIVQNMLQQMLEISDNAGETEAHRAINYLTIRSKDIYYMAWQMQETTPPAPYPPGVYFLQSVNVQASKVQGNRNIVDVIFQYDSRDTSEIAYWYVKVDVTGQFPFMTSKQLSRYYPAP